MTKVKFVDAKGVKQEMTFASRGEASRFVRGCIKLRVKAQIVTQEALPTGRYGGYGMIAELVPVHCMTAR